MWRRKVALASRFETLGLDPADPDAFDDSSWPEAALATPFNWPRRPVRRGR
jgi:hypothetical protein